MSLTDLRNATITLALLLIIGVAAIGQTLSIPATHAGNHLEKFTAALNSGDEAQWKAYILEDPKAVDSADIFKRRLELFQFVYADLGGVEPKQIMESSEYSISALSQAVKPSGPYEWVTLILTFDSLPPYGWASFAVRPATDPNEVLPEGELTAEKLKTYIDAVIDELVAEDRFSGAVLVARYGQPLYRRAVGEASRRYHIPNQIDTKINLGSMNKMFTGVAIGQLAQQGKLSFDDNVGKYLPDYPNADVRDKVTIHHLLTHTSGMGDYWEKLFDAHWWEIKTVQQLADLTAEQPLEFEPGAKFSYSNAGPIVLGLIIEKISGMSYYDYIRENITGPAGMVNTDCYEVDRPTENLAIGYTRSNYEDERTDTLRNNLFMHAVKGGPAGGGYSTVDDLLAFDVALQTFQLLDEEHFNIVTTGKVDLGPDAKYAYLFGDRDREGHRVIGHNGGAPGINAVLSMYVDLGYTVAVLSNYDDGAMLVADKLNRLLLR